MTHQEVMGMMEEAGLPFAYSHFAEGESPDPPFAVFLYPGSRNFPADGKVYFKARELAVELYTDLKDPEMEERLEAVFDSRGIFYEKTETWIASEKLYEVRYGMEV